MTAFTVNRIPAAVEYFTEPLLEVLGDSLPLDVVLVPAGCFTMGSPDEELDRDDDEGPQHKVTLPSFFMGRYPVTQAQWRAVASIKKVDIELDPDPSSFKGANHPVEQVSWYEAVEFCERLKKLTQRPYRLPSEAEWEYSCRAGATTPFAFGKTLTTEVANYDGDDTYYDDDETYNGDPFDEYREKTTPVDKFGCANAFGLSDMHGNVNEWCADHWHENYEGAPTDGSPWLSANETSKRLLRGGSYYLVSRYCRSAYRVSIRPDDCNKDTGFRVCCSQPRTFPSLGG